MKSVHHPDDRAELLRRLRTLTPQAARRWGRMTPHQMVCHLSDAWRISLGERASTPAGNVATRTVAKWLVLYTAMPIPKGVTTSPELDQEGGGTSPSEFAADVETLASLIERSAQPNTPEPNPHPAFGQLTRSQWARFNYRHMNHHLRQFGV